MKAEVSDHKKTLLYISTLCSFLIGLEALIVSPLIPAISSSESFSPNMGGLLVTVYALFYGLAAPIFGSLSDRWGRKNLIVVGMGLFALATVLLSFGHGLYMLLIFRAIAGIGGAMVMPSIYALIGDLFSEGRGKAMAMVTGGMSAATMLGVPAGSFLAGYASWRVTFLAVGMVALLVAFGLRFMIPQNVKSRSPASVRGNSSILHTFSNIFSQPAALIALLCIFLWWAGFQGLFANMGTFYATLFSLQIHVVGYIFSLSGFASLLGNLAGGRLSDNIGRKPVIYAACILCGAAMLSIPFINSLWMVIVLHVVWAFGTGLGQSSLTTMAAELNPQVRGTILAMSSSATYLGMTMSTAFAVPLLGYGGFPLLGSFCAVMVWLVVLLFAFTAKTAKSVESQTQAVI